ncbi:MAG: UDP-3-O-(3-hydroxymyristoyl)glucosamine N-acyltransferase [Rhizobiales bacterium]|nr:UDP-3-O-(3-hydroxymyristoyl)glucosamine N-acyltransferase [Hyphomicrobiales bacterium]
MDEVCFFTAKADFTLGHLAELLGLEVPKGFKADFLLTGVSPLDAAQSHHLSFLDNPAYAATAHLTKASAVIVGEKLADKLPATCAVFVIKDPYRAFARACSSMFPAALRPEPIFSGTGIAPGSFIHPDARLEHGVTVDPSVVIGPHAEIGSGSVICAGAVIGPNVRLGRNVTIGSGATIVHTLVGNDVIIHAGARIGQDGFGFAMGPQGHMKVPQVGRVIIQDRVEIGANTTIDRGANRDTIVGEGTKIDNLVQIGHNVVIGRHCVIVAQVGISGSTRLGDYVVMGGQSGSVGHVTIGTGAQIAGTASVSGDIPAGERWGGTPARPLRQWGRELATLQSLAKRGGAGVKAFKAQSTSDKGES